MDYGAGEERAATVAEHLERWYGTRVDRVSPLDLGVFRVDLEGAQPWVARIFPPLRPRDAVEGDAGILRLLETAGFPAERCATPDPVSDLEDETVLVTTFVEGDRTRDGRTFATLGSLLGRLHAATATARPNAAARAGGAWHHVAPEGGLEAELDGTEALLRSLEGRLPPRDRARSAGLRRRLQEIDLAGLPEALLHPDFVPANVIRTPQDGHVLVDLGRRRARAPDLAAGLPALRDRRPPAAGRAGGFPLRPQRDPDRRRAGPSTRGDRRA